MELIKEKRKLKKARRNAQTESLEDSLARGPPVVQGEYDRDFRRFGQVFAVGDRESIRIVGDDSSRLITVCTTGIATDALKDIVITLQMTLLQNLQLAWGQETMLDFTTLEYASEESRVNSVVALGQLYQRLATAAPIQRMSATAMPATLSIGNSRPDMPILPPAVTPPSANPTPVRPDSGRWSTEKASRPAIYNLFRKPLSDSAVPHTSQESLVPRYLLPAISAEKSDWLLKEVATGSSRDHLRESISSTKSSDASSSIFDPNDLWQKTWGSPEDSITGAQVQDPRTSTSRRRVPTSTLEVATAIPTQKLLLPCEGNNFAGFCKARPYSLFRHQTLTMPLLTHHRARGNSNPASRRPSAKDRAPAACTAPRCSGAARNACSKAAWPSSQARSARRTTPKSTTHPASSGGGCSCSNRTSSSTTSFPTRAPRLLAVSSAVRRGRARPCSAEWRV